MKTSGSKFTQSLAAQEPVYDKKKKLFGQCKPGRPRKGERQPNWIK